MRLDDVRTALDSSAEEVPPARLGPDAALTRVRRRVRRRRSVRIAALATMVVVASAAVIAVVDATGSQSRDHIVVSQSTTTIVKRASLGLSAEQLRAYDGVGVAAGWAAVDAGNARVFVPQSWIDVSFSGCTRDVPSSGSVSVGVVALQNCDGASHLNNAPPTQAVALVPSTVRPTGRVVDVVHGYRVYAAPAAQLHPGWTVYDVPQLHLEIALQGSRQRQVLATLAPSSRAVALAFAAQPAPTGHVYAADGVRLMIPTTWPVADATSYPCFWPGTVPGTHSGILRISPNVVLSYCQLLTAQDMRAFHDGVYLFPSSQSRTAPAEPTTAPLAVFHHGETTLRVYAEPGDSPSQLDVFFRRTGSSVTHVIGLGLGTNGRVAGGVLASIEATS